MARIRTAIARHDGLAQAAFVLGAVGLYEAARVSLRPDWPLALANAHRVHGWERAAGLAWEAPLQRALLGEPWLLQVMDVFYLAHFLLTVAFFVWLYRRSRGGFLTFRNGFALATGLALLVAWRFPTAPPRTAGIGVEDTLRRLFGLDIGSPGSGGLSDPVAAIPSLHAGWAVGVAVGIVIHARSRAVKLAAPLYPAAVVLTILATGNHFVIDALAGAVVMGLGLGAAALPSRTTVLGFPQRRGVEQPGSSPGS